MKGDVPRELCLSLSLSVSLSVSLYLYPELSSLADWRLIHGGPRVPTAIRETGTGSSLFPACQDQGGQLPEAHCRVLEEQLGGGGGKWFKNSRLPVPPDNDTATAL